VFRLVSIALGLSGEGHVLLPQTGIPRCSAMKLLFGAKCAKHSTPPPGDKTVAACCFNSCASEAEFNSMTGRCEALRSTPILKGIFSWENWVFALLRCRCDEKKRKQLGSDLER